MKDERMAKSKVSIIGIERSESFHSIKEGVGKALDLIGGLRGLVKPGQKVLINPSWVAPPVEPEKGCITQVEVTEAVAEIVRELGAHPIIAESSAVGVDSQKIIDTSSYRNLIGKGYEVVDLRRAEIVKVPVPQGKVFREIETYRVVREADLIIPIPKLKTHDQTEITCSIKKIKGLLSDKYKKLMHQDGLFEGVVDFLAVLRPQVTVVDAVYCQEGLGPVFGRPVKMNLVLAGKDLVAVDAVAGRMVGFDPREVPLTQKAFERGLGTADLGEIENLGLPLQKVQRRFMRSVEDDPVRVAGFNLIHGGVTCTGCRNTVMSALVDLRNAGQLKYLSGITVITGDPEIPQGVAPGSIVAVGKCVPEGKRGKNYVRGCPPNNAYVVQGVIGERAKAKRMYAEGGLEAEEEK
jgi:uncharacterized protein (DUF362 family)